MPDIIDLLGQFDKLTILKKDPTIYTKDGLDAISHYINTIYNVKLPIGFVPFINTKSGKIATRVEKFIKATTGQKMAAVDKEKVGTIADRHVSNAADMIFDFHDEIFDWPKGHFGNENSCWRNSHSASHPMFRIGDGYGKGFTMRIFATKPHTKDHVSNTERQQSKRTEKRGFGIYYGGVYGYGRIWIMPWEGNSLLIMNPYGETYEWYAGLLREVISQNYDGDIYIKRVDYENKTTGIYSNSGSIGIITIDEPFEGYHVRTSLQSYVTKSCSKCKKGFPMESKYKDFDQYGYYCDNCGFRCSATAMAFNKDRGIPIHQNTYVMKGNQRIELEPGDMIADLFGTQITFCVNCMVTHRTDEECENVGTI